MNARLLINLKRTAVSSILTTVFSVVTIQAAQAEAIFLFRSPGTSAPAPGTAPRIKQKILKLDEKGDLLIQCGCARFIVAYNEPADRLKASEQQQNPQREYNSNINGISLTASLSF